MCEVLLLVLLMLINFEQIWAHIYYFNALFQLNHLHLWWSLSFLSCLELLQLNLCKRYFYFSSPNFILSRLFQPFLPFLQLFCLICNTFQLLWLIYYVSVIFKRNYRFSLKGIFFIFIVFHRKLDLFFHLFQIILLFFCIYL